MVDGLAETGRFVQRLIESSATAPGFDFGVLADPARAGRAVDRVVHVEGRVAGDGPRDRRVCPRRHRLDVPRLQPDARAAAPRGNRACAGRLGGHRSGRAALLGPSRCRSASDHPRRVGGRGAGAGGAVDTDRACQRVQLAGVPGAGRPRDVPRGVVASGSGAVCVVSGGGWGVGDLEGAVRVALGVPGMTVVCLCGTNAELRARLTGAFGGRVAGSRCGGSPIG